MSNPPGDGRESGQIKPASNNEPEERASSSMSRVANTLTDWLTSLYDFVVDGGPGLPRVEDAVNAQRSRRTPEQEISNLIRWSVTEAAGIGFLTNIGGLITLPVALPANLAGVLAIQLRMVAGIAHLRGYDIRDRETKTMALLCLLGASAAEALADAGVVIAGKLAANALARIPGRALVEINKAVGFRLLTRTGSSGVLNIGRYVPLLGGVVTGAVDAVATQGIATAAKAVLVARYAQDLPE